jgi:hypothetical protein
MSKIIRWKKEAYGLCRLEEKVQKMRYPDEVRRNRVLKQ